MAKEYVLHIHEAFLVVLVKYKNQKLLIFYFIVSQYYEYLIVCVEVTNWQENHLNWRILQMKLLKFNKIRASKSFHSPIHVYASLC